MRDIKEYFNDQFIPEDHSIERSLIIDLYEDLYKSTYFELIIPPDIILFDRFKLLEWLCQENLIGQEITEELYTLWKLST